MNIIKPKDAKFVAVVEGVKELRLIGTANLDFWNGQLTNKPFKAFAKENKAEITIAATDLAWNGFRFNELTISLAVAEKDDEQKFVGYFLLHAFNSNRFFAFCERAFFSTPYYFGKIDLDEKEPFSINVWSNDLNIFNAEMSDEKRPKSVEEENWEGAIFLPNRKDENYFIGKLSGESEICPFLESDKIELKFDKNYSIFESLINSDFAGTEWRLRSDAFHAKSKTYRLKEKNTQ